MSDNLEPGGPGTIPAWLAAAANGATTAIGAARGAIGAMRDDLENSGLRERLGAAARHTDPTWALGLRPPINRYGQRLAIPVRLPNGLTLRADHFWPATREGKPITAATVLIRTPYYRQSAFDARLIARQGFHVVVVSSRGRFGSQGEFDKPMLFEAEDGQGVVEWLRRQPFFNGELVTWGQSYLGFTQWVLAVDPPPELKAMVVKIGPHRFVEAAYPGGTPASGTMLYWAGLIHNQQDKPFRRYVIDSARSNGADLERAIAERPLLSNYPIATGAKLPFFEEWITSAPTDPFWALADGTEALQRLTVPVLLQTGWFDLFLNYTFEQYRVLRDRGQDVQLTIGPWAHPDPSLMFGESFAEAIAWVKDALGQGKRLRTAPVKVAVTGSKRWRELDDWPPPSRPVEYWLAPDGELIDDEPSPADDGAARYRFDPSDPPPALGGAGLTGSLGEVDDRPLEARADVITFTSQPLAEEVQIGGEVMTRLFVSSSRPTADFFVRLCDVAPRARGEHGLSVNVCDSIRRVTPATPTFVPARAGQGGVGTDETADGGEPTGGEGGSWCVDISLGDIAHRFAVGHRLRLVIASGAAPRYQPNPGVIEPPATAAVLHPARQAVWFGAAHPSAVRLPVIDEWPEPSRGTASQGGATRVP